MKTNIYLALSILTLSLVSCKKNTWTDDSAVIRFQDERFLQAILENPRNTVDKNNDGQISEKEARTATVLDVSLAGISSMDEIKYFTSLTVLSCYGNELTALDVSNNTSLTKLNCSSNELSAIDVGNNPELTLFYCDSNQLSTLDVSRNTLLEIFDCSHNSIASLDVSRNTLLQIYNSIAAITCLKILM